MARSFGAESLGADGFAVRGPVSAAPSVGCALVELGSNQLGWSASPVALNSDLTLKASKLGDTFIGDVVINRTWVGTPTEDKNVIKAGRYQSGSLATVNSPIAWYEHISDAPYPYCGFVLKHGLNPGIVDGRNPGGSYIQMIGPTDSFGIQFDYLGALGTPNFQGDVSYSLTGSQSKHLFKVNNGSEVARIDTNGLTIASLNISSGIRLIQNVGSQLDIRADNGLRLVNAAANTWAALSMGNLASYGTGYFQSSLNVGGNITAGGNLTLTGANSTISSSNNILFFGSTSGLFVTSSILAGNASGSPQINVGAGSAATPCWTFRNCQDTGPWLASTTIGSRAYVISTDGAEAVRFGGSGVSRAATFAGDVTTPNLYGTSSVYTNNLRNIGGSLTVHGPATFTSSLSTNLANTDYTNVGGAGAALLLNNSSGSGQNVLANVINGTMVSKWRNDYNGNMTFVASNYYLFTDGDYSVGKCKIRVGSGTNGVSVSDVDVVPYGHPANTALYVYGNSQITGTIVQGALDARWTVTATGKRDSQVGNGAGTWQTGYREEYNAGGIRCAFFGLTPVAQFSTTGQTAGRTAGSGATLMVDDTLTGGLGSTAYTVGDVVRGLKTYGLLAL